MMKCFLFGLERNRGGGFTIIVLSLSLLPHVERPTTPCEQHRERAQSRTGLDGAFIPQCDEQGQYRSLQCHGSTGHCWCVDSSGQERAGTRTPPGTSPRNCDISGKHTCATEIKLFVYSVIIFNVHLKEI